MKYLTLAAGMLLGALSVSSPTLAQGVPGGAAHGAAVGANAAGPVGAVVGGVVGGAIGGVEGVLGVDQRGYVQPVAVAPGPVYAAPRRMRMGGRHYRRSGYVRRMGNYRRPGHSRRVHRMRYR